MWIALIIISVIAAICLDNYFDHKYNMAVFEYEKERKAKKDGT